VQVQTKKEELFFVYDFPGMWREIAVIGGFQPNDCYLSKIEKLDENLMCGQLSIHPLSASCIDMLAASWLQHQV
jgi:hypothetical protein